MQADSAGAVHFIHNAAPEDHDLKRQYLTLLTPKEVIDICLTLDIHVPVSLKRNIWPADFKAAIASKKNLVPKVEDTPTPIPAMGSLEPKPQAESKTPQPSSGHDEQPVAGPSTQPVPAQPVPSLLPPAQPYGFSTQPAYPHTPYYQAIPSGYPTYSYPYPPPPNGFPPGSYPPPTQPFPPPPPGYPQQHPFYHPSSHPEPPPIPHPVSEDTDLPSYEDMIVEGLNAVNDAEGMAPKDLFNWMAGRYPVQSNFRPSASQALQKAYRRGRFEKGTNGRYRLNPNWEGGNSSTRRATRRPQTANAMPNILHKPRIPALPFTAAPRPPPPQPVTAQASTSTSAAPSSQPTSAKPTPAETPKQTPPVGVPPPKPPNGPYEAAQNLLQTINFGRLFKLEDDERRGMSPVKSEAVTMSLAEHARAELQAQLALLAAQLEELAQQEDASQPLLDASAPKREDENDDDVEVL
ncbi:hypothetical protein DFH07DRAFT_949495 [Mycena maculata]|uniref:Histone H1 n=1 Tax=Mycena maculata TaxID=230809 RepID=A0AAD7KCE3_9AGAR|nr:hypothetical protein DFH07DRAFT_949495 [Mycena maculata]